MITIDPILIDLPEAIIGEKVILKPTQPGDGKKLHDAIAEHYPSFTEYYGHMHADYDTPPTPEVIEIHCRQRYAEYILRNPALSYNIYDKENNYLGFFEFIDMDFYGGFTKMSGWLRPSARNKGYMTDTIKTMTDFAFDTLDMNRVSTKIDEDNLEALALMDRVDFAQEGILKNGFVKHNENGAPANMVVFARVRKQATKKAA